MRCYHTILRRNLTPLLKSPQPNSVMEQPKPLSPAHKAQGYCVSTYLMVKHNIIKTFLFPMVNWQLQKGHNSKWYKLQVNLLIPDCERSYAWEKDGCLPCQIKATAFWPKWANLCGDVFIHMAINMWMHSPIIYQGQGCKSFFLDRIYHFEPAVACKVSLTRFSAKFLTTGWTSGLMVQGEFYSSYTLKCSFCNVKGNL